MKEGREGGRREGKKEGREGGRMEEEGRKEEIMNDKNVEMIRQVFQNSCHKYIQRF
jgi:hypothetical protein